MYAIPKQFIKVYSSTQGSALRSALEHVLKHVREKRIGFVPSPKTFGNMRKMLGWLLLVLCLTGCASAPDEMLRDIRITSSEGRDAQIVRNTLIPLISPDGYNSQARYTLNVMPSASKRGLNFSSETDTARNQWVGRANFTLQDRTTSKIVLRGQVHSRNSYSEPAGQFASHTVSITAKRVVLEALSREIYFRILAWIEEQQAEHRPADTEH